MSPDNQQRYRELVRVWALTRRTEWTTSSSGVPQVETLVARAAPSADTVIRLAESRRGSFAQRRTRAYTGLWMAVGAAAVLIVSIGVLHVVNRSTSAVGFSAAEFVTRDAETVTATLRDGSIIHLAPHSRLRLAGPRGRRDAWLEGRVFFAVAKHQGQPFTVRSRAGTARVVRARFELVSMADSIHVRVIEGRVALFAAGVSLDVDAGHQASATEHMAPVLDTIANPELQLAWMRRFLVFRDTPLVTAVAEIKQQYGARVRIADPLLGERTVTGWFDDEPLDRVLKVLCRITDADCVRDPDGGMAIRAGRVRGPPPRSSSVAGG